MGPLQFKRVYSLAKAHGHLWAHRETLYGIMAWRWPQYAEQLERERERIGKGIEIEIGPLPSWDDNRTWEDVVRARAAWNKARERLIDDPLMGLEEDDIDLKFEDFENAIFMSGATAEEILAACPADETFDGIRSPDVDAIGTVTHATGTGRLRWSVTADGSLGVYVHRLASNGASETVISAHWAAEARGPTVEIIRPERVLARHWNALVRALVAAGAPRSDWEEWPEELA